MTGKRARAGSRAKSRAKPAAKSKAKGRTTAVQRSAAARAEPVTPVAARDALDDFIAAAGRTLELPVEPAWQGAIKANLDVTLRLAALYADFPLPDDAEPAPVFVA
jgi:1-carboxybiuret hydrolase subunit AtzG-like protein